MRVPAAVLLALLSLQLALVAVPARATCTDGPELVTDGCKLTVQADDVWFDFGSSATPPMDLRLLFERVLHLEHALANATSWIQRMTSARCDGGKVLTGFSSDGSPMCEANPTTPTIEKIVSGSCAEDKVVVGFAADGTPVCELAGVDAAEVVAMVDALVPPEAGPRNLTEHLRYLHTNVDYATRNLDKSLDCQDDLLVLRRDAVRGDECVWARPGPDCPASIPTLSAGATADCSADRRYMAECTASCSAGYATAQATFTCFNATWWGELVCQPLPCTAAPAEISTAAHVTPGSCAALPLASGQSCQLGCAQGYGPAGGNTAIMQAACRLGAFEPSAASCEPLPCTTTLSAPADGAVDKSTAKTGESATYSCASGFTLEGVASTTCQADGTWSTPPPVCQDVDECGSDNGGCQQICTNKHGSFACSCDPGYQLKADGKTCEDVNECATANGGCEHTCHNTIGSFSCSCNAYHTLAADGRSCTPGTCAAPPLPSGGGGITPSSGPGTALETRTYTCPSGRQLVGASTITCHAPNWSAGPPACQATGSQSAPADSCSAIKAVNPSAGTSTYYLTSSVIAVHCDMSFLGGGWMRLNSPAIAAIPSSATKQYLYRAGNNYYLSPTTTMVWNWSSYQQLTGTYTYGGSKSGTFSCSGGEGGHFGIGCSRGGGNNWKCLPWGGKNPDAGTGQICQDTPDAFGVGACHSSATIYVRW